MLEIECGPTGRHLKIKIIIYNIIIIPAMLFLYQIDQTNYGIRILQFVNFGHFSSFMFVN